MAFQRSPWTLLGQNPDEDLAAQIGLMPSQVTPDPQIDASVDRSPASAPPDLMGPPSPDFLMKMYSTHAHPGLMGPPSPSEMMADYSQAQPSQAPQVQNTPAASADQIDQRLAAITGHGKGENMKQTEDSGSKTVTTGRVAADDDEYQKALNSFTSTPDYQRQLQDISDLRNKTDALIPQADKNAAWVKPLLALADSQTGSHLMQGYTPGLTPQERNQLILKYQDEISKRQNDLTKEARQGAMSLMSGTQLQQFMKDGKLQLGIDARAGDTAQNKIDEQDHRQILQSMNNNKIGNALTGSLNQLKNGLNLLSGPNANPQSIQEAQMMIRGAIQTGSGSRTGVDERAHTYINSLGLDFDSIKQFLTGDISKVTPDDPIIQHLASLSKNAGDTLSKQLNAQINLLSQGHGSMYDRRPDLKQDLLDKINAYNQIASAPAMPKSVVAAAKPAHKTPAPPSNYDGSAPLPQGFTPEQKAARLKYLQQKAGQ